MVLRMKHRIFAVALTALLSACAGAKVDVKTLATSPRPLSPVPVEKLQKFEHRPDGAVAVFNLDAYGDTKPNLDAALNAKAANLGCDGLVFLVHKEGGNATTDATTGQLNDHTTKAGSHLEAVCIVLPTAASAAEPAPSAAPAAAPTTPPAQAN